MENKNMEKPFVDIITSVKLQEEKTLMKSNIIGEEEGTSSVINQETLAIDIKNNTTDHPSTTETITDHSSPSILKNDNEEDDDLKSTKAEMGEVREENERLKALLTRILKDYQSLQKHFFDIVQQEEANNNKNKVVKPNKDGVSTTSTAANDHDHDNQESRCTDHDDQLVSLSLGRSKSSTSNDEYPRKSSSTEKKISVNNNINGELALGLGRRFEAGSPSDQITMKNNSSFENSFDQEQKEEAAAAEMWPPSKVLKPTRSTAGGGDDDGVSQISPLKKARVSVRARCDTPTMNDGCQWRKYGQKIAKGNPCPRAYYRCTVSPSCPVRKQVQRCMDDMSILITTYEGTHNHPLPISATAMASTTSAAASMLQSRSTTSSQPSLHLPSSTLLLPPPISNNPTTSSSPNLLGLNINNTTPTSTTLFQNSRLQVLPQQFYFPNTSISTSSSHPTVTLDLTAPNPSSSSHILGRGLSSNISSAPRFASNCLSFSAPSSSSSIPWTNNYSNGYLNYGNGMLSHHHQNPNYKQQPFQEANSYQSYMNNNSSSSGVSIGNSSHDTTSLTETIAAATKAITSNPKFQSALAAALTSFVGKGES